MFEFRKKGSYITHMNKVFKDEQFKQEFLESLK